MTNISFFLPDLLGLRYDMKNTNCLSTCLMEKVETDRKIVQINRNRNF